MIVKHFFVTTFLRLKSRNRSVVGVYVYFFSENIDDTNSLTPTVFAECHDYIHNRQTVVHLEPWCVFQWVFMLIQ